jgi:hypothetical protein
MKNMKPIAIALALSSLPLAALQAAPTMIAYNGAGNRVVVFDATTPGTLISDVALTGLTAGEFLIGLDARPANGMIYSVAVSATTSRVVTINPVTGAVTSVGSGFTPSLPTAPFYGIDFNPVPDRIRVVSSAGLSLRLTPTTGVIAGTDTNIAWAAGDPNAASTPAVTQVAYTNSVAGATLTTLFAIDFQNDVLARIGGVDGTPSPNTGTLTTIGALGVATNGSIGGFDIDPSGVAFAVLRVTGVSNLYRINLTTGAATLVGPVGAGTSIDGLTVAPTLSIGSNMLNFGTQTVNTTSATASATLANTSAAALTISGITAAAAPFTLVGGTCAAAPFTLAVGASCTLSYAFTPSTAVASSQNLTVSVGGVGAGTISLSGTGTPVVIPVPSTTLYGQLLMALMLVGMGVFATRQRG